MRTFSDFYFSYNQLMVGDRASVARSCKWTQQHYEQGFVRISSLVCFRTLIQFGNARVTVELVPFRESEVYQRVISVPLELITGSLEIVSPDDNETIPPLELSPGHYRLTCAQYISSTLESVENDEGEEAIDLFFDLVEEPIYKSEILVADAELSPPSILVETCESAGE